MNEAGEPMQNAEARIQYLFNANWRPGVRGGGVGLGIDQIPSPPSKTDANGMFVLRGLPQDVKTNLEIKGPRYAQEMHFQVPVGAEGLEFRLKPEGRIEGRLTYADTDAPVTGRDASVALQGIHPTAWDGDGHMLMRMETICWQTSPLVCITSIFTRDRRGGQLLPKNFIKVVEGETVSNVDLTLDSRRHHHWTSDRPRYERTDCRSLHQFS